MPFAVKATLENVETYLQKSGYFAAGVQAGVPMAPPQGEGLFGAVFMRSVSVNKVYANGGTEETHLVTVRVHRNAMNRPADEIEFELAVCVQQVVSDLIGDYDLGATVREIDVGGMNGTPLRSEWGQVDIGGVMFRVVDIMLPLTVDDSGTAAQ